VSDWQFGVHATRALSQVSRYRRPRTVAEAYFGPHFVSASLGSGLVITR
jgi:hypothetical protein